MATVRLETSAIEGWESFHDVCAATFGFPDFYGSNLDAWIDCLTYLDDGMSRFDLPPGEVLMIEVADFDDFQHRAPELAMALTECTAFVNGRSLRRGEPARLALRLC
jgi:RNAse (barnase) inhibitor barstar